MEIGAPIIEQETYPGSRAFRAKQKYDPGNGEGAKNKVPLEVGDEGYVQQYTPHKNWHKVWMTQSKLIGFVPTTHIEVGAQSGFTITGLQVIFAHNIARPLGNTVLEKTIRAVFSEMNVRKAALVPYGARQDDLEVIGNPSKMCYEEFMKNMNPKVREIIQDGSFSFRDLWQVQQPQLEDGIVGIYLNFYRSIDGSADKHAWYVGMSKNIAQRATSHRTIIEGHGPILCSKNHCQIARRAKNWKTIVLFKLKTGGSPHMRFLLRLAENTFVMLLQSWTSVMFADINLVSSIRDFHGSITLGRALATITNDVFSLSGWPKFTRQVYGCNWNSPIGESTQTTSAYTKYEIPGVMDVYRSEPRLVERGDIPGVMYIRLLNLWASYRVKFRVSEQDGFYLRCLVYIEYQIMKNGRPHAAPFVRLPYIGPFTNWAETACLGLRATWQTTTGTWRSMWLQKNNRPFSIGSPTGQSTAISEAHLIEESFFYAPRLYLYATYIMDYLQQTHYEREDVPNWYRLPNYATIKTMAVDHFNQKINLTEQPRQRGVPIRFLTFADTDEIVRMTYNPDVAPTIVPGRLTGGRRSCDMCFYLDKRRRRNFKIVVTTRNGKAAITNCVKDPAVNNGRSCGLCAQLQRSCTYTNNEDILDEWRVSFPIVHREPYQGANPIDIPSPVNVLGGVPENVMDVDEDDIAEDDDGQEGVSSGSDTEDDESDGDE